MRFSVLAVVVVAVVVVGAAPQRKLNAKYDNVDVDMIIGNGRILTNYIKCAMDEGPCTAEGRELKKHLPDAIKSNCSGCNEQQKKNADKLIAHMRTARKRDWDRLLKKFDPTGERAKASEQPAASAAVKTPVAAPAKAAAASAKVAAAPAKVAAAAAPASPAAPVAPVAPAASAKTQEAVAETSS